MKNKKGLTLIELLVVIAILSILVVLTLPNVLKVFNESKKKTFVIEAQEIAKLSMSKFEQEIFKGNIINTIKTNGENELKMTAGSSEYYIKLNSKGKIKFLIITNDNYCIKLKEDYDNDKYIKIEDIKASNVIEGKCDLIEEESTDVEPIEYIVTYDSNGGVGEMTPTIFEYDIEQSLSTNTFTKVGYTFDGWNTKEDGSETDYEDGASVTNLATTDGEVVTLYAKWKPITYTVSYNANGGSGSMTSTTHTYDASKTLSSNTFTRSGYTFDGWNTKSDGSGTNYANGASVKNLTTTSGATVTLYAKWADDYVTYTYSNIKDHINCSNLVATSNTIISYGGDCSLIQNGSDWKLELYGDHNTRNGTHNLTFSSNIIVDMFAVGGGSGGTNGYGRYSGGSCSGGTGGSGGKYISLYDISVFKDTTYSVTIGSGGATGSAGTNTMLKQGSNVLINSSNGATGGSGGAANNKGSDGVKDFNDSNSSSYYAGGGGGGSSACGEEGNYVFSSYHCGCGIRNGCYCNFSGGLGGGGLGIDLYPYCTTSCSADRTKATPNTGGGGGGGDGAEFAGNGASGILIIRPAR